MAPPSRLTSSRDIREVFGRRISAGSALLVVHAAPQRADAGPGRSRAAVVAGRAVGNAVQRNRAKRRLRAALGMADAPGGLDLVVTAKRPLLTAPFTQVLSDLESALRRVTSKVAAA